MKKAQTHYHTMTFRKKNGVACGFNAYRAPSDETRIDLSEENIHETKVKQSTKNLFKNSPFLYCYD